MKSTDLKALLKRVVELVMPDLRSYYRVVRKAVIVKTYASDGRYWADVQPLRNDESVDGNEPVIPKVEIPIIWAGPNRGIVCPPVAGAFCDLEYYDGDPDYPRISNFRWHGQDAPVCAAGALIIQRGEGVYLMVDAENNIRLVTTAGLLAEIGGDWSTEADGTATLKAPNIVLDGEVSITQNVDIEGTISGDGVTIGSGEVAADGDISSGGDITCSGSNPNHHTH